MHFDVIMIGSGISSLTCAALLAKKGKSVAIIERYRKPGGYLHCFSRFGCSFETGAHYVGSMAEGQPFHTLLSYLGVYDQDMFIPLDPNGFDVFKFPTFEFELPCGHDRAAEALIAKFPKEESAIRTYFDMIRTISASFPTYQFNEETDANTSLEYLNTSLATVVEKLTDSIQLRCLLYSYCTLHCVHPADTPFGFHAVMTDSLLRGAYGFRHGGDALARGFIKRIEELGGKLFLRHEVSGFEVEDSVIQKIKTNRGVEFTADWIISGIHPKTTFELVGHENLSPAFLKRLRGMRESVPFMGLYAACKTEPALAIDKNYYAFTSEDPTELEELRSPPKTPRSFPKGAYFARNNRSHDPGSRGYYPLTMHAPASFEWFSDWQSSRFADRPAAYHELKNKIADDYLTHGDRVISGLKDCIEHMEVSTPLSNMFYNGTPEGSAYGIYHSIANTGMRGLGPRTHIRNLLLTGQNAMFPGLLASCISGLRSAGHIMGIRPILKELRTYHSKS